MIFSLTSLQAGARNSVDDLYSVGKTVFICIVLLVNAEVPCRACQRCPAACQSVAPVAAR